jgi:hypothetical protein
MQGLVPYARHGKRKFLCVAVEDNSGNSFDELLVFADFRKCSRGDALYYDRFRYRAVQKF